MKQHIDVRAGAVGTCDLYYSGSGHEDRCIGHLRGDFGKGGNEFWPGFFPHEAIDRDDGSYKGELNMLLKSLRKNLLKSRKEMRKYIQQHPPLILEAGAIMSYGYQVSTEKYDYYIRCSPYPGVYNFYIYIYIKEA